jgi:RimJ/RimL family protein N-acetyltransferase
MIFIARLGDKVVGFTSLAIDNEKKEMIVYDFMIRQEFQAKGHGTELMQFVMNKAKLSELDQIVLWVDDVNIAAKKLYGKFGFKFQKIDLLDWNNEKSEVVLQTKSEELRVSFTSALVQLLEKTTNLSHYLHTL